METDQNGAPPARPLGEILVRVEDLPRQKLPTDADWRERCIARLKEIGLRQRDLAAWVKTSQSNIQALLFRSSPPPLEVSDFVERISVALRVELPLVAQVWLAARGLIEEGDVAAVRGQLIGMQARLELALEKRRRG